MQTNSRNTQNLSNVKISTYTVATITALIQLQSPKQRVMIIPGTYSGGGSRGPRVEPRSGTGVGVGAAVALVLVTPNLKLT